ncbi:MAG: hypothetical protein IJX72_06485 [Clostridia bacterium]|nr:hypothetical protein [Clostridia bacterium]
MQTWKYQQSHDPMLLTMHDCIVTRIDLETTEDHTAMTWHLPDGIWVAPEISGHELQKTCRTHEARTVFEAKHPNTEWDQGAAICMKSRWHGKDKRMNTETWEHMTITEFVEKCNRVVGHWRSSTRTRRDIYSMSQARSTPPRSVGGVSSA